LNEKRENKSSNSCTIISKERFYKNPISGRCEKYCPLECETISHTIVVDTVDYPQDSTVTYIVVYYRNLKYTSIRQEPKLYVIDLVSMVGGTFSLFIGLTFVNLMELLEILSEVLFIVLETYRKNSVVSSK
jgi:predicted AAA+ superfamily ATPase